MNDSARFAQLRDLFNELSELDPDARALRLAELRAADPALADELARMLQSTARESLLDRPAAEASAGIAPGLTLGAWRIEKELGRGGMGVVYLARRADGQFERRAAIKLLRRDRVDEQFLRRFERERRILAGLDHPHIAAILDAGTSPAGDPYFVMEYVDGVPLNEYARNRSLREKLQLFLEVCDAVQQAHRNLTVHRDLKPGNILVTKSGSVKLLDFGIAKFLEGGSAEETLAILTPAYASPEQIRHEPVTTASDVFSLGVLLYELVSGRHPFQPAGKLPHELMRAVIENDPPPITESSELNAIAQTAMRKQPEWRYPSVEQLSNDVARYLRGETVLAKGDSVWYRARKFLRRQWLPVAATAAVILSLAAGIVATRRQAEAAENARVAAEVQRRIAAGRAAEAEKARAEAEREKTEAERQRIEAEHQRNEAQRERAKEQQRYREARGLADSMLFEVYDGVRDLAGSAAARRLIVEKAQRQLEILAADSKNDPGLKRDLAAAWERMGELRIDPRKPGAAGMKEALDAYQRGVELRREIAGAPGSKPDDAKALALSIANLGEGYFQAGNLVDAEKSFDQARQMLAGDTRGTGMVDERRCGLLAATGHSAEGMAACREAIDALTSVAAASPEDVEARRRLAATHASLANALRLAGRAKEGAVEAKLALESYDRLQALAPNNAEFRRQASSAGSILANVLAAAGDQPGSLEAFRKSSEAMQVALAIDPSDLNSALKLAVTLLAFSRRLKAGGSSTEAHDAAAEALRLLERAATRPSASALEWNEYADALLKAGFPDLTDPGKASGLAKRAVEATHRKNPFFLDTLAWSYYRTGDAASAVTTKREALALLPPTAKGGLHDELEQGLKTFSTGK